MYLIFIKLLEVVSRALFVVGATYLLPVEQAGQFGMLVTTASLFAFAGNYDRHHDIQRRAAGLPAAEFDRLVKDAVPFWGFNMAVVLPVYVTALMLIGRMPVELVLLTIPVAVGEQISAHAYQMATVEPRYNRLVTLVAVKNSALVVLASYALYHSSGQPTLAGLIMLWAAVQTVATVAIVSCWLQIERAGQPDGAPLRTRLFRQHRASFTHFQIGAVAIATLQFDRIGVGALLGLIETGIYFRHVLAVSFTYQFFSITFVNRVTPKIFNTVRTDQPVLRLARRTIFELAAIFTVGGVGLLLARETDRAFDNQISNQLSLSWPLMAILLAGTMIRLAADCAAVFCNAWHQEKMILRAHLSAFSVGAAVLFTLTPAIGITGPALAALAFSSTYITLLLWVVLKTQRTKAL